MATTAKREARTPKRAANYLARQRARKAIKVLSYRVCSF